MKKALLKDAFKEIKTSYKRFISILCMALLGVGFFAGLRATSPDMVDTIDKYYKEQNVYDIQIMSTLGLTDDDIKALQEIENVDKVYGTYSEDVLINIDNKEYVSKIMSLEEVNKPVVTEGKLPENKNECLVEKSFLDATNKKIGDEIIVEPNEENELLQETKLKITGVADSPVYISRERGNTDLGAGAIDNYIYVNKENIDSEIYTEIYVTLKDRDKYETSSNKYEDYVEETKTKIEEIKEERENARYDEVIGTANEELEKAEKEFNDQKEDGEKQISDAEEELEKAKKEIEDNEKELVSKEQTANSGFSSAEKKLKNAKNEISENEKELEETIEKTESQIEEAEKKRQELVENLDTVKSSLKTLNASYDEILKKLEDENLTDEEKEALNTKKEELEKQISALDATKKELASGIKAIEEQVNSADSKLKSAKKEIEKAKKEVNKQEKQLATTKFTTYSQINSAKEKIEDAKKELEEGEKELATKKEEFETKIADAEKELIDAKEDVEDIENPEWYILDRNQNTRYASYIQDTESINNLSIVFPIVFFAIAALVSLTSMTRMVEEERQELGTLKALGYNKFHIMLKYLIYSSLATIIGGVIGIFIGIQLIPRIVLDMYGMMYTLPDPVIGLNSDNSMLGLTLIYICIVGATIYAIIKELHEKPANLLRPKAPKIGKRVLLERITPIWKRLNFSRKVTVRNIFRYKKRVLMTIIGICGCTALILTGFGLKDSISEILPNQYEKVFNYDFQVTLKDSLDNEQREEFITELENKEGINKAVETYMSSATASKDDLEEDVQIVVPNNNEELKEVIKFYDVKTDEDIDLKTDEIILSDKLAELLNVEEGETIKLDGIGDSIQEVKVSNITENYISHYVYMSKELYTKLYDEEYKPNVLLVEDDNLTKEQEEKITSELLDSGKVSGVSLNKTIMTTLDETLSSLNYVVVILIVSAGLLAFVVLYNLANVNISERIRELATIKVLGFYDKEVYNYISRETVILTVIGIALGLVAGYFLNYYIIRTCEINMLRFAKVINPLSYLYAILITVAFTLIVNVITYFALKKIDMISSLKSVE